MKHLRLAAGLLRRRSILLLAPAMLLLAVPWLAPAQTAPSPAAPINDNYLNSLSLNQPGHPLNSTDTLRDVQNTANATVQSDLFSPQSTGGGAELTTCRGVSYGNTIWYDFHPQADGQMEIRTSGFDNVIALYPYSLKTLLPDNSHRSCVHQTDFPSETMVAKVKKGVAYTVQVGGVDNGSGQSASGQMEVLFDYFIAPPHKLTASSTLTAAGASGGIKLVGLSVNTVRTAKVTVNCGSRCRQQSKTHAATETFPSLKGTFMPAGSKVKIYVTAPHSIGVYIEYDIVTNNFSKVTRCLEPGSRRPRKSCH